MSTVKAVNKLFLFRIEGEEGNAWKVAYQTDASTSESRAYDSNETKDGTVKAAGAYEASHSLTSYLKSGDTYIAKLKDLVRNANSRLEVWGIDRTALVELPEGGSEPTEIPGEYSVDVVTSVNESAGADGNVEISIESEVEKGIVSGDVTVNAALKALLTRLADEFEFEQPVSGS